MPATNVWKITGVKRTIIRVEEQWARTYVRDSSGSVNDFYVENILEQCLIELLGQPTIGSETCEELKWSRPVIDRNEP